jgi:hypothetical protein
MVSMTIQIDVLRKQELLPSICGMPLRRGMDEAISGCFSKDGDQALDAKRRRDQQVSDQYRKERNLAMYPAAMDRLTLGAHVDGQAVRLLSRIRGLRSGG